MLKTRPTHSLLKRWQTAAASAQTPAREERGGMTRGQTHTELKMTRLPSNGLMVTTVDSGRPVSRLALVFRAGSRYESPEQRGMAHRIRSEALAVLGEASCKPAFKRWELEESEESLRFETLQMKESGPQRAMELLHRAAYRTGSLGNSLYCPTKLSGTFKEHDLAQFARDHLLSGEAALIGLDVDHELVLSYATEGLDMVNGQGGSLTPSKYRGGEERKDGPGPLAHVMLAGEGAGLNDAKGLATLSVLAGILGTGPHTKWSEGSGQGRVARAISKQIGGNPFNSTAFSVAHADSGLFGIYCVSTPDKIGEAVKAGVAPMKDVAGGAIKEEELEGAKVKARNEVLFRSEGGEGILEDVGSQTLASGSVLSQDDILGLITAVSANDVQAAAKKLISSKLSMAAVGNTRGVPYLDEL